MARSRVRRGWKIALAVVAGLLALAAIGYALLPPADLRSDQVAREGSEPAARERGRELLRAAAETHGLAAWRERVTQEIVAVDHWPGGSPWWPQPDQRIRVRRLLGTFTSRVELLDGPAAGEVRGIQSWAPYRIAAGGGEPRFATAPDPAIEFYLPTLHYLDELPFRLLAAETVTDAGPAELGGRRFERVFATWGGLAAHPGADQYELWIDPESHRLEKVAYTVRDAVAQAPWYLRPLVRALAVGTLHYDDFREVDGVLVPFLETVTLGGPAQAREPLAEHFVHRLTVEEAAFDGFAADLLRPDPSRPEIGDRKPVG